MAYSEAVKLRAFQMYVLHGKNAEEITRILKTDIPTLSANTIRDWISSEKDPYTGSNWEESRKSIDERSRHMVLEAAVTQRNAIHSKVKDMREKLLANILSENAPEAKSLEGMIFAVKALMQFELQLEDEEKNGADPLIAVQIVLEVLSEDEEAAPVIKRRWPRINAEVIRRMNALSNSRDITQLAVRRK